MVGPPRPDKRCINAEQLRLPGGKTVAVPGTVYLCGDRHNQQAQRLGLLKRLCSKKLPSSPVVMADFEAFVRRFVARLPRVDAFDFEAWLENTAYNGSRKEALRQAHDALHGGRPSKTQRQRVTAFAKSESYPEVKHLRWICTRCDAVKAYVGPALAAVEHILFYGESTGKYFAKFYKGEGELAAHIASAPAGLHYAASDYTAFEAQIDADLMRRCECVLYNHCLSEFPERASFICRMITGLNKIKTRDGVSVRLEGRRMSGDMCTSLGNSFTNLMVALYAAHVSGDDDPWVVVEGDDGLCGTSDAIDPAVFGANSMGLTIKWEPVSVPTEAGFCGKVFGPDRQVIRDPVRFFQTFGWSDVAIGMPDWVHHQLLVAKALSAAHETPDCPLVRAAADYVQRVLPRVKARHIADGYHTAPDSAELPPQATTWATRTLFARKFGISEMLQIECEDHIRRGDFEFLAYALQPHHSVVHQAHFGVT